jgi:hypothetical protein
VKNRALVIVVLSVAASVYFFSVGAGAGKEAPVTEAACYECHDEIKALKTGGKHAKINCISCHSGTAEHLKDSDRRPTTRFGLRRLSQGPV